VVLNKLKTGWRGVALNLLVLVAVVVGVRAWQQRDMASGAAPALSGTTLSGSAYTLQHNPPRPMLVHFWATWCPICRAEQGHIDALSSEQDNVITVAMQSGDTDSVTNYMRKQDIRFPTINDRDGMISARWGVHAVPASFIVAPDGTIAFVEVGYTTNLGLRLRLWWAGL
jgi:thiol-disulfide isomerase/thioredoxin